MNRETYDRRYRRAARRFELAGGAVLLAGVLLKLLPVAALGVLVFGYGFGSLQPANQIKAFARQCLGEPGHEMAQGLLNSLEGVRKVRLTGASIRLLEGAVEAYAQMPGSDPERVERLREAVRSRVSRTLF